MNISTRTLLGMTVVALLTACSSSAYDADFQFSHPPRLAGETHVRYESVGLEGFRGTDLTAARGVLEVWGRISGGEIQWRDADATYAVALYQEPMGWVLYGVLASGEPGVFTVGASTSGVHIPAGKDEVVHVVLKTKGRLTARVPQASTESASESDRPGNH